MKKKAANATLSLLRGQIVSGRYASGSKLPSRRSLLKELGGSPVTLQRALDRLEDEGFVFSKDRVGTFVSAHPPHLDRFAVLFPPRSGAWRWSRFMESLSQELSGMEPVIGGTIDPYFNIEPHIDNPSYARLVRSVHAKRLAGLLFVVDAGQYKGTPILEEPGVPRVAIHGSAAFPGVPSVYPDFNSFIQRALGYLAKRRRKRVAVVAPKSIINDITTRLSSFGMMTHPYWVHVAYVGTPLSVQSYVHLLGMSQPKQRPDALVIGDDHFVGHALEGLAAAGISPGKDIDVVAHWNFPLPTSPSPQIQYFGFDSRQILVACFDLLVRQRLHEKVPIFTEVPAITMAEYSASRIQTAAR